MMSRCLKIDPPDRLKDNPVLSKQDIVDLVVRESVFLKEEIFAKTRLEVLSIERQKIMALLMAYSDRYRVNWGLRDAGMMVGKGHATVLYGRRRISDTIDTDPKFRESMLKLVEKADLTLDDLKYSKKVKL